MPIIDLHFHPEPGWAAVLPALFDELGVQAAGNGASDSDEPALDLAARFPGRVIAFGGGPDVRRLVLAHGEAAWQLQAPEMEDFLARLESLLAEGRLQGIGELHVDNQASNIIGSPQYRFPADSPLMQRVFALSARYGVPVSVHLDADPDSVAEMERLLEANRDGTWLWAHCGHYAEPELIRRLLAAHPNLHCELSYRVAIMPSRTAIPLDAGGVVKEDWRALLGEHSDRFVIGTDLGAVSPESYAAVIRYWRNILGQLSPEAVARIAHLNAERLLSGGE